jgi:hypothetical protein
MVKRYRFKDESNVLVVTERAISEGAIAGALGVKRTSRR